MIYWHFNKDTKSWFERKILTNGYIYLTFMFLVRQSDLSLLYLYLMLLLNLFLNEYFCIHKSPRLLQVSRVLTFPFCICKYLYKQYTWPFGNHNKHIFVVLIRKNWGQLLLILVHYEVDKCVGMAIENGNEVDAFMGLVVRNEIVPFNGVLL